MDKTKLHDQRYEKLGNGKGKKVGIFESVGLKLSGISDGLRGFPRMIDERIWYSTFMNREVNSYEEFCSHIWGSLQIESESGYARLEELMNNMLQIKRCLETTKMELNSINKNESDFKTVRKRGEDKLTDAQVQARRNTERNKKTTPLKNRIVSLEQEMKNTLKELSELYSRLVEDNNTTRLICNRVKNHVLMRIDVYWNSALMHHPDEEAMPIVPVLELKDEAERTYLCSHKELMERTEAILEERFDKEVV